MLPFGFVYIHPFEDGTAGFTAYLIHHILAPRVLNPPGIVFPVRCSDPGGRIETTRRSSKVFGAAPRLVDWEPTKDGNVEVLNEDGSSPRFFE